MPVADLDAAGDRLWRRYGLVSVPGGRHPGVGTANRIVPLGSTYIELISIVDAAAAAATARGRRISRAVQDGLPFVAWAARCPDLDAARKRALAAGCGVGPVQAGSRETPAGDRLGWRSMELSPRPATADPGVLPFLIQWDLASQPHPGSTAAQHLRGACEIMALRFRDPAPERARGLLGALLGGQIAVEVEAGPVSGLTGIELGGEGGRQAIP